MLDIFIAAAVPILIAFAGGFAGGYQRGRRIEAEYWAAQIDTITGKLADSLTAHPEALELNSQDGPK